MTITSKFEVGKSYACRSLGDYDCIHCFEIIARTEKTITTTTWSNGGKPVRRRITLWDGVESFKPFGTYSMCATIYATEPAMALAASAAA